MSKSVLTVFYAVAIIAIPSALAAISWPAPPEGETVGGNIAPVLQTDVANNRIGIGTDSPSARLEVAGNAGQVTLTGDSTNGGDCGFGEEKVPLDPTGIETGFTVGGESVTSVGAGFVCTDDNSIAWNSGEAKWWNDPATVTVIDDNGYLGINTATPDVSLDVNGNAIIRGDGAGEFTSLSVASGNVGIGTANASAKLDVVGTSELNGDTEITGDLNVNGNAGGTSGWTQSSDLSLKANIRPLTGLDTILKLNGVRFDWKASGTPAIGVIAQEVEKVFPEVVRTDSQGLKSVDYASLVAPLIEAVKELEAEQDDLLRQVGELEQIVGE